MRTFDEVKREGIEHLKHVRTACPIVSKDLDGICMCHTDEFPCYKCGKPVKRYKADMRSYSQYQHDGLCGCCKYAGTILAPKNCG
jgi:hypothetical protein